MTFARYGRMASLMCSVVGTCLFGGLGALAQNYGTFAAMRFLVGVFQYGLFGVAFVWCKKSLMAFVQELYVYE